MNVTITSPFWKQRRDQIVESVIPYQWGVMNDEIATEVPDDPAAISLPIIKVMPWRICVSQPVMSR